MWEMKKRNRKIQQGLWLGQTETWRKEGILCGEGINLKL